MSEEGRSSAAAETSGGRRHPRDAWRRSSLRPGPPWTGIEQEGCTRSAAPNEAAIPKWQSLKLEESPQLLRSAEQAAGVHRRRPADGEEPREKALMRAARDGNLDVLKGIVKSFTKGKGDPAVIFSFNLNGLGVLHYAACAGHLEICKYLVELGGDVNATADAPGFLGVTPFMAAAQSSDVPTVRYLLDHGGDLMKADDKGRTVLHHASASGCCKVTEFLLSKGVPVDLDCGHGTPLYLAATNEKDKTLKILLDHHANPNVTVNGVASPLMSALVYRSLKCMKLLIKAGADVNVRGSLMTPLLFATSRGGYTNFIQFLLKAGADPNIPDDLGRLPIELAAKRDCKEEVEMLFPLTSAIPNVPNWSIEGVISHAKFEEKKPMMTCRRVNYKELSHLRRSRRFPMPPEHQGLLPSFVSPCAGKRSSHPQLPLL
ncbi:hypothetical protein ACQ4PT_025989 [Festuca glaucescens]